jgi:AraC family transcriptional regulator
MSSAIRIVAGSFGRAALLEMTAPLVTHAHHHCHLLIKTGGADAQFQVRRARCPLTDSQAVLVNAWEPHAYLHHPIPGATTEILALYIEPEWLQAAGASCAAIAVPDPFVQPVCTLAPYPAWVAGCLASSLRSATDTLPAGVETLLAELVDAIILPSPSAPRPRRPAYAPAAITAHDARIRRAIEIMRENVGVHLDLGIVAARCGLSRAHFFELFHRDTRVTPALYSNELRMEIAFECLARPAEPIGCVSDRLGFSAPGHFTRFFRGHIGVTPRAFRAALARDRLPGAAAPR